MRYLPLVGWFELDGLECDLDSLVSLRMEVVEAGGSWRVVLWVARAEELAVLRRLGAVEVVRTRRFPPPRSALDLKLI